MKKFYSTILITIALSFQLLAQNLIPNPGFESGTGSDFTNWNKFNEVSGTFTETTTDQRSGGRTLQANLTSPSSGNQWRLQLASDLIPTVSGQSYTFKIWVKSSVAGNNIRFSTNPNALYSGNFNITNANTYQQISWTFTANSPSTRIVLDLANGPTACTYHLDDMEMLQPVNTNPSLLLNGGFEQVYNLGLGTEGWNNWGKWNGASAMTATNASGEFRSGSLGVKAVIPSTATAEYQVQLVSDPATLVVGAQYTFSIYSKRSSASSSTTSTIRFSTNGGTALYSGNYVPGADWTLHTWTFTATNASTRMVLDLGGSGAGVATYFLDDANLQVNCGSFAFAPPSTQMPIATGKSKFLGGVFQNSIDPNFNKYFNQVAPENSGKWGSVETSDGVFNWTALDAAVDYAAANNFPFRFHVLLWGNQQPTWLKPLNDAQKVQNIRDWMNAVASRYNGVIKPKPEYIEVLNEIISDPPNNLGSNATDNGSGDYVNALKSLNAELHTPAGDYDWIVNAFKLARQYFGCDVKLMINEYGIENTQSKMAEYVQIVELLKTYKLVDVVGIQAHSFSTRQYGSHDAAGLAGSTANLTARLGELASTGLPIMVTELEIDGDSYINANNERVVGGTQAQKDAFQLSEFQRIFPIYWNHPSVIGITTWGYRTGMWRTNEQAYLVETCLGLERPAFQYLNTTIRESNPSVTDFSSLITCNLPPVINCKTATVFLDQTGNVVLNPADIIESVSDPENGTLTYTLSKSSFDCGNLGENTVTLTVTDNAGLIATCSSIVMVVDQTPVTVNSIVPSPASIWPPNNRMIDVVVNINSIDNCEGGDCIITSVSSNESTDSTDWDITGPNTLKLRAKRNGSGDGRIYTINIECTDASGNVGTHSTQVLVPHDKGARISNIGGVTDQDLSLLVYGNPNRGNGNIKLQVFSLNEKSSIQTQIISAVNGNILKTISATQSGEMIDLKNNLTPGTYIIRSIQDDNIATWRIVIE